MKFIKTTDKTTGEEISLSYQDLGSGQPIVLIHGWPLCKEMFEYQTQELVKQGLRVIAYDRRGFGMSCKPLGGYDYDTLTDDLRAVMEGLNLQNAILVGFSMGGGEVARYFSRYGGEGVSKVILISDVLPYLVKTDNNEDGVDQSVFDEMLTQMKDDRIGFLDTFGKQFFGVNLVNHPVSTPLLEYYRMLGSMASPIATQKCAVSFSSTDFRNDVPKINVPTLLIHGDADKTVPIDASANRTAKMLPDCRYLVYEGEPHGLFYTAKEQLNRDMLDFIMEGGRAAQMSSATTDTMSNTTEAYNAG